MPKLRPVLSRTTAMTIDNQNEPIARRKFLKKMAAASTATMMMGAPKSLPAAEQKQIEHPRSTADSCILLWMAGGMAAPDTFDPKRYHPFEVGTPVEKVMSTFPAIDTAVDDIKICAGLEKIGSVMDRASLIRSHVLPDLGHILHSRHQYHWHTGYVPPQTVACPHIGAWMAKVLGPRNPVMPPFINIGQRLEGLGENEEIKSFSCEDVRILIKSNIVAKLKGKIYYEKQKNFRMTYKSIFGLESDIGSNDSHFWFWSKRMKPRSVYYAVHEDLHRTRLKTPFNPLWIMESLSLGAIDTKNIRTAEDKNNNLIVLQDRISITGEKVTKSTLIDQKNKRVIGHYVMRLDGTLIASTEIIEFKEIDGISVPTKILIIWHDENVTMEWELSKSKVNQYISDEKWEMPSYDEKVNMGE